MFYGNTQQFWPGGCKHMVRSCIDGNIQIESIAPELGSTNAAIRGDGPRVKCNSEWQRCEVAGPGDRSSYPIQSLNLLPRAGPEILDRAKMPLGTVPYGSPIADGGRGGLRCGGERQRWEGGRRGGDTEEMRRTGRTGGEDAWC